MFWVNVMQPSRDGDFEPVSFLFNFYGWILRSDLLNDLSFWLHTYESFERFIWFWWEFWHVSWILFMTLVIIITSILSTILFVLTFKSRYISSKLHGQVCKLSLKSSHLSTAPQTIIFQRTQASLTSTDCDGDKASSRIKRLNHMRFSASQQVFKWSSGTRMDNKTSRSSKKYLLFILSFTMCKTRIASSSVFLKHMNYYEKHVNE